MIKHLGLLNLLLLLQNHRDLLDLPGRFGLLILREAGRRLGIRGLRRSTLSGARDHRAGSGHTEEGQCTGTGGELVDFSILELVIAEP